MTEVKVLTEVMRYVAQSVGLTGFVSAELKQVINAASNLHRKHSRKHSRKQAEQLSRQTKPHLTLILTRLTHRFILESQSPPGSDGIRTL